MPTARMNKQQTNVLKKRRKYDREKEKMRKRKNYKLKNVKYYFIVLVYSRT